MSRASAVVKVAVRSASTSAAQGTRYAVPAAVAAGVGVAAYIAGSVVPAQSESNVFSSLKDIGARLSTIEEALGINFQGALDQVGFPCPRQAVDSSPDR